MDVSSFISPKELIKAKGEIVEQALARSKPIIAMEYHDGIVLMAENPSESLQKINEIYDRIAFAGTGAYNDYERLRRAGVQYADVKGFSYSRRDVKARALASEYSSILGDIFTRQQLPWEVEILVVEIGDVASENRMYMIPFSGGLVEESRFCAIGDIYRDGEGNLKKNLLRQRLADIGMTGEESLEDIIRHGYEVLKSTREGGDAIAAEDLEIVAVDRTVRRDRKMRRLSADVIGPIIQ